MSHVLIVIEPAAISLTCDESPQITQAVSALKQAILPDTSTDRSTADWQVEVVTTPDLAARLDSDPVAALTQTLLCPLTLNLPDQLRFAAAAIYQTCRDITGLRQQVAQWHYATGSGTLWLPIVHTAKGALYAEVIGQIERSVAEATMPEIGYHQPVHLSDEWRQPLYALGFRLLKTLNAPPAVYLMQFGITEETLYFDRLLPFPDLPAIASLGVQTPDLFRCHWYCLTSQPIYDLTIAGHQATGKMADG
ncbi:hypothetical protein ACN4EK_17205 [Pantanalinema rosaneae CENA516]|uniref:hypothetical protein n=1 Tax=Pantanalinema rosaneae TaxID=1620701 RepID=UPI003D6F3FD3